MPLFSGCAGTSTCSFATRLTALFLLAAGVWLQPGPAHAQQTDLQPDTLEAELSEVQIEAARATQTEADAPFSVAINRRSVDQMRFEPALTLDRVLGDMPGIWVKNRENYALGERMSVRGQGWRAAFGVRGIQVLLDGVPITVPDGQTMLDVVDPAFIRSAELIRGPSSSFWGNASGGTLFLSTRKQSDETTGRLRTFGGSHDTYKVEGVASGRSGEYRYQAFGSYLHAGGYREHSRHEAIRLGGHIDTEMTPDSRLRAAIAFVDAPDTRHPGSLTREQFEQDPKQADDGFQAAEAGKTWRQGQFGLTYTRQFDASDLRATAYGIDRFLNNPLPFADIVVDRVVGGARVTLADREGLFTWGGGMDFAVQRDDRQNYNYADGFERDELTLDQLETVTNTAGFFRAGLQPGPLSVHATVRYDLLHFRNDDRMVDDRSGSRLFSAFSPSFGASYRLGEHLMYANLTTAFETPTTTELVNRPDMTGGFNPELQPERTIGTEAGSRGALTSANLNYDIAVYYMQVRNRLIPFQTEEGGDREFYRNAGLTRHRGAEVFGVWEPVRWLRARATYTLSDFVFQEVDEHEPGQTGNQLPGIPRHRLHATLRVTPGSYWVETGMDMVGRYYADDANTAVNEGYTVLDVQVGHRGLRLAENLHLQPFVKVDNLADTHYSGSVNINAFGGDYYEPAAGRSFQAGFSLDFGGREAR